jgi:bifunctional non-homologous end joining protein LigD
MRLKIGNPDKVFFPQAGISKADLADYYERIVPTMLPHLKERPLTLHRFPDGIEGVNFIQKNVSDYFPDWIKRVRVEKEDGTMVHALADNADTLRYLVDQGTIALHVWLSREDKPHHPDRLIFDLDPPGDDFQPVVAAARAIRNFLDRIGLTSFVMTTGSSGLHVTVPLDRTANFDETRQFAQDIATLIANRYPKDFTTEQRKNQRKGRVYLDVQRNAYAQTGIAPYSVRAKARAPIATPLEWKELSHPGMYSQRYGIGNIFRRLAQRDCPWRHIDRHHQSLERPVRQLHRLLKKHR